MKENNILFIFISIIVFALFIARMITSSVYGLVIIILLVLVSTIVAELFNQVLKRKSLVEAIFFSGVTGICIGSIFYFHILNISLLIILPLGYLTGIASRDCWKELWKGREDMRDD